MNTLPFGGAWMTVGRPACDLAAVAGFSAVVVENELPLKLSASATPCASMSATPRPESIRTTLIAPALSPSPSVKYAVRAGSLRLSTLATHAL